MNTDSVRKNHSVSIFNRDRAELAGVTEVESFHDSEILLSSSFGDISVEGENLKIDSFSVESGKIVILGNIRGLFYFDKSRNSGKGLFSRKAK